jgi:hypothetical protein
MKMTYNWLVAGMLVTAAAAPVLSLQARSSASVQVQVRMAITDAMAYTILEQVEGSLEAQLNQSLSLDFLFQAYKNGRVSISFIGNDGVADYFEVCYEDGIAIAMVEDE